MSAARCAWRSTRGLREVHSAHPRGVEQGRHRFARQLYLINLGDWVSYYWAEKKGVDPSEIAVINMLKGKLAEVK
jgi:hypothetical protein